MKNINDINTETVEGKLLLASIAIITTESRKDQTPDEVLKSIEILAKNMFRGEE